MRDAGGGPEMPRSGRLALKLQVEDLLGMSIHVVEPEGIFYCPPGIFYCFGKGINPMYYLAKV